MIGIHRVRQLIVTVGVVLAVTLFVLYGHELADTDSPMCRPVRMAPSYARILGFDEKFTKYASKYSLYLYREQGKDLKPTPDNGFQLDGTPVLFIPGNAGSYRQVRSIASKTTNIIVNGEYDGENTRYGKLDFFTADFNEDFTAFHGRTMLDQAEYLNEAIKFILKLYSKDPIPPKSVLVVGHSMGGIVARVMLTLPNYKPESVKAILTLSSPHAKAPLTFDRDMMKIYHAINDFWSEGRQLGDSDLSKYAYNVLNDTSIVSITGGLLDTVLPADYTTLRTLVPETNGFTVFTTGIPGVWTSIDHLAVVWCDQLRTVVSNLLLDMVDTTEPEKVVSLERRLKVSRNRLMTGFETPELVDGAFVNLKLDRDDVKVVTDHGKVTSSGVSVFKLGDEPCQISIIGPYKPTTRSIFVCNDDISGGELMDLTHKGTTEYMYYKCQDITDRLSMVPRYNVTDSLKDSTIGDQLPPNYALELDSVSQYKDLLILDYDSFVQVSRHETVEVTSGTFEIQNHLRTTVKFPKIKNSLLVYDLSYDSEEDLLIKQTINEETKWHITNDITMNFHGDSPYLPSWSKGLQLDIWNTADSKEPIKFTIKLNPLISLKMLYIRYRITILSYMLMTNLVIFIVSLYDFHLSKQTKFPRYFKSFDKSLKFLGVFFILNLCANFEYIGILFGEQDKTFANSFVVDAIFLTLSVAVNYLINQLIVQLLKFNSVTKRLPETSARTKYVISALLVLVTLVYLPYQVVYVVLLLVQIMKLFKLKQENEINFNILILNVMLWVLPINIPILIVLIHNLTISWTTSFSSHHNVLSILPIIYLVNFKRMINFRYMPFIIGYLCYFIGYCYYYGSINTFWLYQLFNYFCIVLIVTDSDWIKEEITKSRNQMEKLIETK